VRAPAQNEEGHVLAGAVEADVLVRPFRDVAVPERDEDGAGQARGIGRRVAGQQRTDVGLPRPRAGLLVVGRDDLSRNVGRMQPTVMETARRQAVARLPFRGEEGLRLVNGRAQRGRGVLGCATRRTALDAVLAAVREPRFATAS